MNSLEIIKSFKERIFRYREVLWDLTPVFKHGLPPIPRFKVVCPNPTCRSTYVCIKHIDVFKKQMKEDEYRLDVWFKCIVCGIVWAHGLHLTKEEYEKIPPILKDKVRTWEQYGHICTADGENWYICDLQFNKCEEYKST